MHWQLYILPVLFSAFSGWLVVRVILIWLFHPVTAISVFGLSIQGILPKNQHLITENLARLISKELITFSAFRENLTDPENFEKLKPEIEIHIDNFLRHKLKDSFPLLSTFIGDKTINQLKSAFLIELEELFPVFLKSYITRIEQELDLEKMVEEKVSHFSTVKLEALLFQSAKKQLIYLQLLALIIGSCIGLIQVLINMQLFG